MILINGISYWDTTRLGESQGVIPGLTTVPSTAWSAIATNWHQLVILNTGDKITLGFSANDAKSYAIDNQTVFYGYLLG
jgi:hypothetical protein